MKRNSDDTEEKNPFEFMNEMANNKQTSIQIN